LYFLTPSFQPPLGDDTEFLSDNETILLALGLKLPFPTLSSHMTKESLPCSRLSISTHINELINNLFDDEDNNTS
jgi:hypothetical protein